MKVTATIVLPANVEIEVPNDTPPNEIKEKLLEQANQDWFWNCESEGALITECSIKELEE